MKNDDKHAETAGSADPDPTELFECDLGPPTSLPTNGKKRKRNLEMQLQKSKFDPYLDVTYRVRVRHGNGRWDELRTYKEFVRKLLASMKRQLANSI